MRTELPYVVLKAQLLTRTDSSLKNLLLETMRELANLKDEQKVIYARKKIDEFLIGEEENSSCKRGCHFCCYQPISVARSEATFISQFSDKVDRTRLEKQKKHFQDSTNIDYVDRACIFLKEGECSIYHDRPLICRLTYVENEPESCHLENQAKVIQHRPVTKAAVIAAAFYMTCPDTCLLALSLK